MASENNLRIIYQNLIDTILSGNISTSATASGTAFAVKNLQSDIKSLTWRSAGTTASIVVNLGARKQVDGIILAFTNLTSAAEIEIVGHETSPISITGTSVTTPTGSVTLSFASCCPWNNLNLPDWGTNPVGSSNYSYGGGTYARIWTNWVIQPQYLGIKIRDLSNPNGYIDISRLIVGSYWSPKYNTGYGMSASIKDLSEHIRTESGDLLTKRGPRVRTLNFDLQWVAQSDRKEITKILLGNGMPKPLFVSLFPDSTGTDEDYQREGIHQIYGKMVQVPGVSYTHYDIYSTSMELEEV